MDKVENIIKLSQNENPFGPSPKAAQAVCENIHLLSRYPEPHAASLKSKIAKKLDIEQDTVFVSAGLVEALDILIRNFVGEGENIVFPEVSFVAYKLLAKVFKKEARLAKMDNYHVDIDQILALCDEKTKIVLIGNPNNPTGTIINEKELRQILENVNGSTLVVIDEAYFEYCDNKDFPDTLLLQKSFPNLVVMRTFSKIYGLAGLRVGYTIASKDIINRFEIYQAPFTVNQVASLAASAALDDDAHLVKSAASNKSCRADLETKLRELGFNVVSSESNFLFVYFDTTAERDNVYNQIEQQNVFIRKTDLFGEEKAFRISIGKPEINKRVMQCLSSITY